VPLPIVLLSVYLLKDIKLHKNNFPYYFNSSDVEIDFTVQKLSPGDTKYIATALISMKGE
jgi:hypothetical protein